MQLRIIPPREVTDVRLDRGASLAEIEEWERLHPTAAHALIAASNYGGSMSAVRKAIRKEAIAYMKGFPGRDGLSENIGPHSVIKKCIDKPDILDNDGWTDGNMHGVFYIIGREPHTSSIWAQIFFL